MAFASPVKTEFFTGGFYDRQSYYLSPDKVESDYSPVRFERELKLFRRYCPTGHVLDVGCSTGGFLWQLMRRFPSDYEVLGTDVAGKPLDHARGQGISILEGSFLEMDERVRKFEAICFWAVLEHLAEPAVFLRKTVALLEPGGFCFALVPNLNSLAIRLLGPKYRYVMPDHLNYFELGTLRRLFNSVSGLQPVACGTSHFNPVVIWKDWRSDSNERVLDSERGRLLHKTTAMKQSPWLWPLRKVYAGAEKALSLAGLADNLWLVARKT
jgi:SAM-dependent methyltransferase